MSNLVVKSNQINSAIQNLSLAEIQIIQLGIIGARETGDGLSTDKPLRIDALRYAEAFKTSSANAYKRLKEVEDTLFNRRFSYVDTDGKVIKSRWIQEVKYFDGAVEIVFTRAVVEGISRIDGAEKFFTSYLLEQTSTMNSIYSVRLYELLTQWANAKKTPVFKMKQFRLQLGIAVDEYKRMSDFKKRVLDKAVKEINEKSNIIVSYEQAKQGTTVTGFKFLVLEKKVKKADKADKANKDRDSDTPDMFNGMTDKQQRLFASKLAKDNIFNSRTFTAPIGLDMPKYILLIEQNLASPMFQCLWIEDLKRVGFTANK